MDQNKQSKREDFCLYNVEKCILGINLNDIQWLT